MIHAAPPMMSQMAHTIMCILTGSDLASGQRWRRGLAVRCKPHGVIRRALLPAYFLAPPTKKAALSETECRSQRAASAVAVRWVIQPGVSSRNRG